MSNGCKNEAFQEFLQKRYEEIIVNDEKCCKINKEILGLEKELLPMLSEEAKVKFLKIDEFILELIDQICIISPTILRQTDNITTIIEVQIAKI